jgi:threonine aldolase
MRARLGQDHQRARSLAAGLEGLPGLELNLQSVQTNIIMVRTTRLSAAELLARLAERGVLASSLTNDVVRLVTHRHIGDEEVTRAITTFHLTLEA